MKVIGLTGGIASGKSTVSGILRELGIPVIDADSVYERLSRKGNRVWQAVYLAFGEEYFLPDGEMNRKKLGALVFSDSQSREKLNKITHPIVKDEMLLILDQIIREQQPPLVVMDVPLLFESGWNDWMDEVWVVYAPEEMQVERLSTRNGLTREEAFLRVKSQMSIEEKRKLADRVIDNSLSIDYTKRQIERILEELKVSEE
ncbi:MAG TPA: dephospho-CoA kinase [Clostridiales bacterium]|nr:dephospho-CoA kinase [Clostridiales bacterium]